jgi:hypothetical protein
MDACAFTCCLGAENHLLVFTFTITWRLHISSHINSHSHSHLHPHILTFIFRLTSSSTLFHIFTFTPQMPHACTHTGTHAHAHAHTHTHTHTHTTNTHAGWMLTLTLTLNQRSLGTRSNTHKPTPKESLSVCRSRPLIREAPILAHAGKNNKNGFFDLSCEIRETATARIFRTPRKIVQSF